MNQIAQALAQRDTVGVVGLGIMGGTIARHLQASGLPTLGYDLDPARRAALSDDGVEARADLTSLLTASAIIITSLPSPGAAQATAEAIAASNLPPRLVIEMSTLALADKTAFRDTLAAAGHTALDCPISGTGAQVQDKDIVVYASGEAAGIERALPILAQFARAAHPVGPYGAGTKMKFIANLLVAIHNVATAEAIALGRKAGLDPDQMVELISMGAGASRIFELRAPLMAAGRYAPATMKLDVWAKDMAIIGSFIDDLGCDTPLFDATQPLYQAALAAGLGEEDTAAVYKVLSGGTA